ADGIGFGIVRSPVGMPERDAAARNLTGRARGVQRFAGFAPGRPGRVSPTCRGTRPPLAMPPDPPAVSGRGFVPVESGMKTQGEIEAAICDGMVRFEQEFMRRAPKDIRAHLIGDLLLIRLQGTLSAAEQHLVKSFPVEKGRDLLKEVRVQLMETARA